MGLFTIQVALLLLLDYSSGVMEGTQLFSPGSSIPHRVAGNWPDILIAPCKIFSLRASATKLVFA